MRLLDPKFRYNYLYGRFDLSMLQGLGGTLHRTSIY